MKRMLKLVALGALVCSPMVAQGQELLVNGDLNSTTQVGSPALYYSEPLPWVITTDPCSYSPCAILPYVPGGVYTPYAGYQAGFADRLGGGLGLIGAAFEGRYPGEITGPVDVEIKQIVPGVAGNIYRFSGWAHFEGGYAGGVEFLASNSPNARAVAAALAGGLAPAETDTIFALEFLDSMGAVLPGSISNYELHNDGGQQNDNQLDGRTWVQHTLRATAPAGTVSVQVRAAMINGEFNIDPPGQSQNVFFDDFSLQVVPEPASMLLAMAGIATLVCVRRRR